ncbi:MAG TPA: hypothetical protein VF598_00815 [Hymenobacter sp.]|jgi:hypothetical protein
MVQILRYSLFCLLSLTLLASCKSVDRVLFRSPSAILNTRLPALEVTAENGPLAVSDGALPEDPLRLFQREVSQNLMEPEDSAKFGYAKLIVTSATANRKGKGLQALQMITLMAPSLLGVPLERYEATVRAQVQVISSQGKVLGSYSGVGISNIRVAMYHGYSQTSAGRLADIEALRQALNQIRPQLEANSDSLRAELLASGPIKAPPSNADQQISARK